MTRHTIAWPRPGPRLLPLLVAWCAFALAAAFLNALLTPWYLVTAILLVVAVIDVIGLWRLPSIEVTRAAPGSVALAVNHTVRLTLSNSGAARQIAVYDEYPALAEARGLPQTVTVPAQAALTLSYELRPTQRGPAHFGCTQLVSRSPFGLWARRVRSGVSQEQRVYPNFAAVSHYALLATDHHLSQLGVIQRRRRGAGLEFHQLREYREGDALRQIDWKASARTRRLISREYQEERNQHVVFLLDCGRRMRAKDAELSHFDHALDAILLLAYVALSQGDGVGLLTFSGIDRHAAARKGVATVNTLLNTVYDLQPSTQTPDYLDAARRLMERFRKRALVVLVTNLRDEDNAELLPALRLLGRRHLVLLASLKEEVLHDVLQRPVRTTDDALHHGAAQLYLQQRRRAHEALRGAGTRLLDVEPRHLAVQMVNRYLDIKCSGAL